MIIKGEKTYSEGFFNPVQNGFATKEAIQEVSRSFDLP